METSTKTDYTVLTVDQLADLMMSWLSEGKGNKTKKEDCVYVSAKLDAVYMRLYTHSNSYEIIARKLPMNVHLSCRGESRMARTGENFLRGRNILEGWFSEGLWNKIMSSIACFEFVDIKRSAHMWYTNVDQLWRTKKGCPLRAARLLTPAT